MAKRYVIAIMLVSMSAMLLGCVRRTIEITSDPPGALVFLNDREVGRTPLDVDFVYYGTYDVRLTRDGYEPLLTSGDARPPLWDNIPFDLVAEAVPGEPHAHVKWHYTMQPLDHDRAQLLDRAQEMRGMIPPAPPVDVPAELEQAPTPEIEGP